MTALAEPPVPRLQRQAIAGVLLRVLLMFSRYWRTTTFTATVQPSVYLLAFGAGFGSLVSGVNGHDYLLFVATGTVATTVMFSSAFPGMFATFVKYKFQRIYDAILAAPVDVEELVTAEAIWIAVRAGVYSCVPLLLALPFGLVPRWSMLLVPPIATLAGWGWACFGIAVAARMNEIESLDYVVGAVITPLFLTAGTFFPLTRMPGWVQTAALANPFYHCVELARDAAFGLVAGDLVHVAVLLAFALVAWRVAVVSMERRLILA